MSVQLPIPVPSAGARAADARRFLSFTARILGNGRETGGMHAVELTLPNGESSPWHVHHEEDEWFYVVDGCLEVLVGDTRRRLVAGDFAFGPRDVPHGFRVIGTTDATVLLLTVGGRFSEFVKENSRPLDDVGEVFELEEARARLIASASRYGQEILGALPL